MDRAAEPVVVVDIVHKSCVILGVAVPRRGHLLFCLGSSNPHRGYLLFYPESSNSLRRCLFFCFVLSGHYLTWVAELLLSLPLGLMERG